VNTKSASKKTPRVLGTTKCRAAPEVGEDAFAVVFSAQQTRIDLTEVLEELLQV
jgi:hypothetical protein